MRFRPDGTVEFRDGGTMTGRKIVDITVSDSGGQPFKGKLLIQVVASNVPPVPVQDHVTVLAGEPVTVEPLKNDYDPNDDKLRLTSVSEAKAATITPNYAAGVFRFESDEPGSYDVTYQITDGPEPVMGLVRVDVESPPEDERAPVAVTDQVLLPTGGTALVDVLANDTDPAGGVLVVQGVDVPDNAPVKVAVLNHQILKISEIKRLDSPLTFDYTVANGSGTTTGQVRVVPIPAPDQLRPPEAGPDEATVHAGDVVTIPVLKNDTHPDGLELTLADELKEAPPASAGEAFASEDTVRFRAGQEAGHLPRRLRGRGLERAEGLGADHHRGAGQAGERRPAAARHHGAGAERWHRSYPPEAGRQRPRRRLRDAELHLGRCGQGHRADRRRVHRLHGGRGGHGAGHLQLRGHRHPWRDRQGPGARRHRAEARDQPAATGR